MRQKSIHNPKKCFDLVFIELAERLEPDTRERERERERGGGGGGGESDVQLRYGRMVLLSFLKKVNIGGVQAMLA